ncbi:hypothetical protein BJX70DRAFT_390231 [Aspergillus crustosus]
MLESVDPGHNVTDQPPQQLASPLESSAESPVPANALPFPSPVRTNSTASTSTVPIPRLVAPSRASPQPRITRACVPCQKKKTRCDGRKPKCTFCLRSDTVCSYTKSKRENEQLQFRTLEQRVGAYESLLEEIFAQSSQENRELIQTSIHKRFQESPEFFETLLSVKSPLNQRISLPRSGLSLMRMHQASASNPLSNAPELSQQPPIRVTSVRHWTSLVDNDAASHLLSLYFTWENPTWQLIDPDLFVHDMEHGRTRFCSSLLVHTLLFFGCSFSFNLNRITDRREEKVLGEKLYAAIQRLWSQERDSTDVPTMQSSILIGLLCCTFGIDKIGTQYITRGAQLSNRMNIPKDNCAYFSCDVDEDPAATLNYHKLVSWAVFDIQALACQVYKKASVFEGPPSVGFTQKEAAILDEGVQWRPYPFQTPVHQPYFYTASWIRSELVVIVNDIARFALKFPGSVPCNEDCEYGNSLYQRLLGWNTKLPWSVLPRHNTTPHVICLHMYYHATIVSLCEIILTNRFPSETPRFDPESAKSHALDTIGSLILLFKQCHGWKSIPIVMLHYFCVAGVHAVSCLDPHDTKWSLVLESSVVGLWHMSLGWGRLCKAFLRTIDLVLKARDPDPLLVPSKVSAVFAQVSGNLWTDVDSSALAADYTVHYVPSDSGQRAQGNGSRAGAQTLQELITTMERFSVSAPGAAG